MQRDFLARVSAAVKPGGRLIYSVCTLTANETNAVKAEFEEKIPGFKPCPLRNPFKSDEPAADQLRLWPQTTEGNGMFIAAWKRSS